ncbi:MAG TPA: RIP metalloprotease RseP [Verrucomicrobiales bacterium]|nr:RIP metalloprotease RseP [Verrucomicrobiales bacterium]
MLTVIYVVVAVLLLFGAAIFIHEWGHYWVALKRGLKVEEFAIGFGPKLFAWKRGEVLWTIRAIPAGGFVKLPQMITSEALEGANQGESLPPISPLSKILVAFAGPFMNVVFAFAIAAIIYFVGLPVAVNPSIVGYVDPQSAEAKAGVREGDRIVMVDGKLVRSWQDVQENAAFALTKTVPVVVERDGERLTFELTTKESELLGIKLLDLDPRDHPTVVQVMDGGAAKEAGLQENDVFLSFGGVPVVGQQQLIDLISKRPDQTTDIEIKRGDQRLAMQITPKYDPSAKAGRIGVMLTSSSVTVYEVQKPGPTPWAQVDRVLGIMGRTFSALYNSKQTGVGAKDLSGPVGILGMLANQVMIDYRLALSFMVLLNINLAILNLLPIPVLDGGHIVMSLYEAVFRRPVSLKLQEYATGVFAILLIGFMLYVTVFGDLSSNRRQLMKSMFKSSGQVEIIDATNQPAPQN